MRGWIVAIALAACSTKETTQPDSGGTDASIDASVPNDPLVLDPEIQALAPDATRISATIQMLAGFTTRSSCGTGIVMARDWILAQMKAIGGLQTMLAPYVHANCNGMPTRDNVVGWIPGAKNPERLVIIGGHYDSRTVDAFDGTSPAPGANDSGSQTSLVLEAARVLAGKTYDATIVFVAFAGEEQGLVGSTALAGNLKSIFPNAEVIAMMNSDIVGGDNTSNDAAALQTFRLFSPGTPRETAPDTTGSTDDSSPSRAVMRAIGTWGAAYVPSMKMLPQLREDRPGRGGDHEPFIENKYPGVRFIEPNENLAHQHTADDLVMYVTPAYTARMTSIVASVAATLARAPIAPAMFSFDGSFHWTGSADHFVLAARSASDNFYTRRIRVNGSSSPDSLGMTGPYYVSVAAVDAKGHESLFAYPELRCEDGQCSVPPDANDITTTK